MIAISMRSREGVERFERPRLASPGRDTNEVVSGSIRELDSSSGRIREKVGRLQGRKRTDRTEAIKQTEMSVVT
jgi:hypothetical protein